MSASWIQDRRRKQAAGYKDDVNASLSDVMGGLEASLSLPEKERKLKLAEEADAAELGAKKTTAEASLLRAKTDNTRVEESMLRRKGEESSRTARDDAKKAESDAKAKADSTKNAESVLRKRAASGAPIETLIGAASADDALGEMDDDAVRGIQAEEAAKKEGATAKIDADKALTGQRDASAAKLRRVPTGGGKGGKPQSPDAALRSEKLRLEVNRLRNEAEGGAGSSVDKAKTATNEKKKQAVLEVENFTSNIDRNIDAVKKMIDQTGTFELTGPEGAVMDRRLTEIATDLAKLADPGSVAREGEVALMRKGLVDSGWAGLGTSNKTAKAVLDALKSDVKQRRAEAYRVRGLDVPDAATTVPDDVGAVPPAKAKAAAPEELDAFFSSP